MHILFEEVLLRKAMEITSEELQVYSSRKNQSRFENFNTASRSKHRAYGQESQHVGKKLLKDSEAIAGHKMLVTCSRSKVSSHSCKGKQILQAKIGIEELDKRLKILEEENEAMKQAFIETMEERKKLEDEIYQDFQELHHCRGRLGNQVTRLKFSDGIMIANPSNEAMMGSGMSQVLCEDQNPCIVVNRDHRANMHFSSWFF